MMVLPLIVWLVELVLPLPAIVEEIAKAIIVRRAEKWRQALGLGLMFGLSETMLFLVNANWLGNFSAVWRLLLTVPMHGATSLVFYAGGKKYWWLGLAAAILMHAGFNLKIAS